MIPRVLTALVFAPGLFALLWCGGWPLGCACVVLSLLMTYELLQMAHARASWPLHAVCYLSSASVSYAVATGVGGQLAGVGLSTVVLAYFASTLASAGAFEARVAEATRALALTLYASSLLPLLAAVRARPADGCELALLAVFGPWAADTGAYFAGRAFGKTKLAPSISPAKTCEGALGGLLTCLAFAGALYALMPAPMGLVAWLALAAGIGAFGMAGDLVESLLKRSFGAKDSSRLIPGHGGVLDRFDSVLFASWAAFAFSSLLFPQYG